MLSGHGWKRIYVMSDYLFTCQSCKKDFKKSLNDTFKKMYVINKIYVYFNHVKETYQTEEIPSYSSDFYIPQYYCEQCFERVAGKEFM
jgi:hypothetical protein